MLVKKANIIRVLLLSIVLISSFMTTANAVAIGAPTITLKVVNDTQFTISFKEIEGVELNDRLPEGKTTTMKKNLGDLQSIPPGESKEQKWSDFAPGINKIKWTIHTFHDNREGITNRDYRQNKATVIFSKDGFESKQVVYVMQAGLAYQIPIKFDYKGQKVEVRESQSSEDNWWRGLKEDELYYNYTVTFKQL